MNVSEANFRLQEERIHLAMNDGTIGLSIDDRIDSAREQVALYAYHRLAGKLSEGQCAAELAMWSRHLKRLEAMKEVDMLQDKAMLANLTVRQWSARKRDKDVGQEVEKNHGAKDAGNFNKLLIDKEALRPIVTLVGTLRTTHYDMTLPWGDNGDRLLPSKMYFDYTRAMRDLRDKLTSAVGDFVAGYPAFKQNARKRLGSMYDPEDYPDASDVGRKFGADLSFLPVPDAKDFRVDLGEDEVATIRADIEAQVAKQQEGAVRDLWRRLHEVVDNIHVRLLEPDAVFRDSLIENCAFVCSLASKLNINDDKALDAIRLDIEHSLTHVLPQTIRDDKVVRRRVCDAAATLLKRFPPLD
jgi:hypothetical protein